MIPLLANTSLFLGSLILLLGVVGLLRFPDFFSRTHAVSMTDTAGAGFICLGLVLTAGWGLVSAKLVMILIFLLLTSPSSSHALAQAALVDGARPLGQVEKDRS